MESRRCFSAMMATHFADPTRGSVTVLWGRTSDGGPDSHLTVNVRTTKLLIL